MPGLNVKAGLAGLALGAVSGYGKGIEQQGLQKRTLALKMLESQIDTSGKMAVEARKHGNKLKELDRASDLRIREAKATGKDKPKGMLKDLAPLLREAREYSSITDEDGIKRMDEGRFSSFLRSAGLGKMADTLTDQAKTGRGPFDPRLFEEAGERAAAEVEAQAGWFSSDATDFAEYGGNRERAKSERQKEFYKELGGRGEAPGTGSASGPETREAADRVLSIDEVRRLGREGLRPGTRARDKDGGIYRWDGNEFQPEEQKPPSQDPLAGVLEDEKRARERARSESLSEISTSEAAPAPEAPRETAADRRFTPEKGRRQVAEAEKRRREIQAKPDDELLKMIKADLMKGVSLIDVSVTWADLLNDGARASRLVRQAKQTAPGG